MSMITDRNVQPGLLALSIAGLLACGLTAPGRADVLFDNLGETNTGAGGIGFPLPFEDPADSFTTGADGFELSDVTFLLEAPSNPANAINVILLNGYAGAELATLGTIYDRDLSHSGLAPYDLSIATPVTLAANTTYWVELVGGGPISPASWGYDSNDARTGVAGNFWDNGSFVTPQPDATGPYQMEVSGTTLAGTSMPEPASLALFGIDLAGLRMVRRRA